MTRHRICSPGDVPAGEARRFEVDGRPVAVVRIDDDLYAIGDICSHQRISLSEGDVHTDTRELECWKHGSAFHLESGEPSSLPATKAVLTYAVAVEGDDVYLEVLDE